jgi:FAD/FMN-containing dehydrogenase
MHTKALSALALGLFLALAPASPAKEAIKDITQLNPVEVDKVERPSTTEQVQALIKAWPGPVSIGGGRFSMGGQTASERTLHLDMRGMNQVLAFDPAGKTITVQAGITWRQIQEKIDPANLSAKIMQSYASFTLGGSLSVNVHGRYVGQGPIVSSVRSFKIVLANGEVEEASPSQNKEIFYGAIGGYGGLGVITEVTLELVPNAKIEREARELPLKEYKKHFYDQVRGNKRAVFHNADFYPPDYSQLMSITWLETEKPVTVKDRLMPLDQGSWWQRFLLFGASEMPFGKEIRSKWERRKLLKPGPVIWRNYEASYDVSSLEPRSRSSTTYALQEYFVPADQMEAFAEKMGAILKAQGANVLNVSVRHAEKDPGTLMAWARQEVFCFVVYYKQGTSKKAQEGVGAWARELIEAVLSVGGTYYLPYQLHATEAQFQRAYPSHERFFRLKGRLDPSYKFRNKLWDKYFAKGKP